MQEVGRSSFFIVNDEGLNWFQNPLHSIPLFQHSKELIHILQFHEIFQTHEFVVKFHQFFNNFLQMMMKTTMTR